MSDITFSSSMEVTLIDSMGTDASIARAARVSTGKDLTADYTENAGLIKFLMKNRHGTPFEHGSMTFRISAPIFVWREFMRHRVGFSYNEESGRYKKLEPKFYIPAPERNLVQVGKAGQYEFVPGDDEQYRTMLMHLQSASEVAYFSYTDMLDAGIAREVARMCLPLNIYSSAYVTCNPRSLMSFLSLRTVREGSTFPSFPQVEIQMVAEAMEMFFCNKFPATYLAFNKFGRVSP